MTTIIIYDKKIGETDFGLKPWAVLGYFGFGNAGDEMILEVLLAQFPLDRFVVLVPPEAPDAESPRVELANRWNLFSLATLFPKCRGLILAGGELFQTKTSVVSFFYYAAVIFLARLCDCPLFVASAGLDPELPGWAAAVARWLLRPARFLALRDNASQHMLGRGDVAPDPVWLWPKSTAPAPAALQRILWILRPAEAPYAEALEWSRRLNDVHSLEPAWRHGFLALHPAYDQTFLTLVRMDLRFFHRGEIWRRLPDIETIMASYDAVVSMRYHGLLLAARLGRPAVALARHRKVGELAAFLSMPGLGPEADAADCVGALRRSWERQKNVAARDFETAAEKSIRSLGEILAQTSSI